jgi:hypothetical protein
MHKKSIIFALTTLAAIVVAGCAAYPWGEDNYMAVSNRQNNSRPSFSRILLISCEKENILYQKKVEQEYANKLEFLCDTVVTWHSYFPVIENSSKEDRIAQIRRDNIQAAVMVTRIDKEIDCLATIPFLTQEESTIPITSTDNEHQFFVKVYDLESGKNVYWGIMKSSNVKSIANDVIDCSRRITEELNNDRILVRTKVKKKFRTALFEAD